MMRVVRASLLAAALVLVTLVAVPGVAGAGCTGPMGPGEECDDSIEEQATTGWVLIPLGAGIGGLTAAIYLAVDHRSRSPSRTRPLTHV